MPKLHAQPTHSPSLTPTHTPTHTPTLFPTANPSSSPIQTCPADCSSTIGDCVGYTCTEDSDCCATISEECDTKARICYDVTKVYNSTDPILDCTMICTDSSNQTKLAEECAGLGIDSANIGCFKYATDRCTASTRTNAGKCSSGL